MAKDWQLAWRNLWRNPKRTWITVTAIFLAVFFSTFMSSMQEGTYARMIDNLVKFYTGYIQIHQPGYWETKSINDSFLPNERLWRQLDQAGILVSVPRLESFTLLSTGGNTRGCALIGIDPERENQLSGLSRWVTEGSYLSPSDSGILLPVNLAANLDAQVGDTLILISQGYHGASATALAPLRGILRFPSPQLNSFGAFMHIRRAGDFYDAPGHITSVAMMVRDYRQVDATARRLVRLLGDSYRVKIWKEMQPDLLKMIEGDRAGAIIMKGILYLVVGFGILGTVIMMMAERRKESGVMMAIGMQRRRLQRVLTFESIFMGMLGVITGLAISFPVLLFMVYHPVVLHGEIARAYESFGVEAVMYFSLIPRVFLNQALTLFVITLVIAVYPLVAIRKLNISLALHEK